MAWGRGSKHPRYYLKRLNGRIRFIKGSHDRGVRHTKNHKILYYRGYRFLLIHNPHDVSNKWKGWVIHGHTHNNDMKNYPFINGERKTINVGVELINYRPVSLDYLISLNIDSIKKMRTIRSRIERFLTLLK